MPLDADLNLDGFGLVLAAVQAHLAVNEADEALHPIQNGLYLQLNVAEWSLSRQLQITPMRGRSAVQRFFLERVTSKSLQPVGFAQAGVTESLARNRDRYSFPSLSSQ
jgi:hypothetical protein